MANYKTIYVSASTGQTVYAIVKRRIDDYFLATDKASFISNVEDNLPGSPTNIAPAMAEDPIRKGIYVLNTNAIEWDNGLYDIAAYIQSGATANPEDDTCLGGNIMRIYDDSEVSPYIQMTSLGTGTIEVDEDYGTIGALAYLTASGSGIQDADVLAYLKTDYDAGNTGAEYVRGATQTNVNGAWILPMYLYAGTYTFVFKKDGQYGPDTKEVTISSGT